MKQASYTEYKWFWLSQSHDSQASIEIIPSPLNLKHAFEKPANVWLNQNHWICEKRYFSLNNYTKKSDLIWSYALHLSVSYFPFIWWSAAPVMAISRCLRDRSFREQIFGKISVISCFTQRFWNLLVLPYVTRLFRLCSLYLSADWQDLLLKFIMTGKKICCLKLFCLPWWFPSRRWWFHSFRCIRN